MRNSTFHVMKRRRLAISAVAVLMVAAIAGGVAWASIPGDGGVIQGCYTKIGGVLRVIDTAKGQKCTSLEVPISWNQQGPKGDKGETGTTGAPGKDGVNGANGTDGRDGVSVTTASESAGANCAGGGVQLTAANGVSYVCNGKDGADGKDGANGATGADGEDGVSVTSAVEPAGTNCANGGSKFTAANGVTYACNGTGGLTGREVVKALLDAPAGQRVALRATCPAGKVVLGGGEIGPNSMMDGFGPIESIDSSGQSGWFAIFDNRTSSAVPVVVTAICAAVS